MKKTITIISAILILAMVVLTVREYQQRVHKEEAYKLRIQQEEENLRKSKIELEKAEAGRRNAEMELEKTRAKRK